MYIKVPKATNNTYNTYNKYSFMCSGIRQAGKQAGRQAGTTSTTNSWLLVGCVQLMNK